MEWAGEGLLVVLTSENADHMTPFQGNGAWDMGDSGWHASGLMAAGSLRLEESRKSHLVSWSSLSSSWR